MSWAGYMWDCLRLIHIEAPAGVVSKGRSEVFVYDANAPFMSRI